MRKIMRFSWLALLVAGLATPALFAGKAEMGVKSQSGSMTVEDKAAVFTDVGVRTAILEFEGTTFKARTHFTVVTRSGVPESKKADFDATKGEKSKLNVLFTSWARELAKDQNEKGVFVLVYVRSEKYYVKAVTDEASDAHRRFTDADCSALEKKISAAAETAQKQSGDEAKRTRDSGLLAGTNFVIDQLKDTSLPADSKVNSNEHKETGGMSILGWVCIIGAVLLGVWVIIALIRMMTGSVNGYGGGYGGGMGGGGGMGFMGGMMGGMFGAMAGMYMYDQMTGGHHYNDNYGDGGGGDTGGDYGGGGDTGEGNFDGGASGEGASGGDWGDSGGGDTGGGGDWGGDSGGGGDFGGGGDW